MTVFVLVCGDNRSCLIGWQVSADDVRAVLGDFEWSFPAVTSQSYSTDVTAFRLTASECASVVPMRHTCRTALASLTSRHAWLGSTASQLRQVYDRRKYPDAVRWVEIEWLGGRVLLSDLLSTGRWFKNHPPHCRVQPWASCLHTYVPLSPSSIIGIGGWRCNRRPGGQ